MRCIITKRDILKNNGISDIPKKIMCEPNKHWLLPFTRHTKDGIKVIHVHVMSDSRCD